ncbi:MAG: hypothetical protein KME64_26670 [Scytonematopsis contorta HA4267-MV1]|nr:hypothetical protein [Scytonematopsis contorta HA4267-MV1]
MLCVHNGFPRWIISLVGWRRGTYAEAARCANTAGGAERLTQQFNYCVFITKLGFVPEANLPLIWKIYHISFF